MSFNSIMFHLLSGLWHLGCTNPISGISHYRVTQDVPVYTSPLKHTLLKNTEKIRSHLTHMVRKLFVLHIDRIWASLVAQMIENLSAMWDTKVWSPWRREWLPTPVFLPGEFHGQRSLVGYSPWGHKETRHVVIRFLMSAIFLLILKRLLRGKK